MREGVSRGFIKGAEAAQCFRVSAPGVGGKTTCGPPPAQVRTWAGASEHSSGCCCQWLRPGQRARAAGLRAEGR